MAIIYPLALPTTTGIANITLTARNTIGITTSPFTLKQQVQQHAGQRWEAMVTLPPLSRAEADEWVSFLMKLRGSFGTFLLGDPNATTPRGVAATSYPSDTPLVNGASQTGAELAVDNMTASITDYLRAGDYFQLGGGQNSRLYKILNDVNTDASGEATFDIWPNLRSSPNDNDVLTFSTPQTVFRLANNQTDFNINQASIYVLSFRAVEAL